MVESILPAMLGAAIALMSGAELGAAIEAMVCRKYGRAGICAMLSIYLMLHAAKIIFCW